MAASAPAPWLAQVCSGPAAAFMASLSVHEIAFPHTLLKVSPTPIGLTPGFLSRGISRHATNGSMRKGSKELVASFLVRSAICSLRSLASFEFKLEQRIDRRVSELIPDGPAEPFVCNAALLMRPSSISSKTYDSTDSIGPWRSASADLTGSASGCLSFKSLRTSGFSASGPLEVLSNLLFYFIKAASSVFQR